MNIKEGTMKKLQAQQDHERTRDRGERIQTGMRKEQKRIRIVMGYRFGRKR